MNLIDRIADVSFQRMILTGNKDQRITLVIRYMPTQESWFMDVEYNDFVCKGLRVTNSSNIMRKYRNVIPFGFSCTVTDGLEPMFIDDFKTRRADLYLLDADDVTTVEEGIISA